MSKEKIDHPSHYKEGKRFEVIDVIEEWDLGFHLGNTVKYIFAPIDTTFGLYKAGMPWSRLKMGIRVLPPYAARHLDWYIDPENLTPDQEYYMKHASDKIAHWSKLNA